ncbi:MAG: CDP-alcohol phosphatidyltransferase [Chlamydiae bacterium]|nr:CDP-alcohol phosphatidyltransferase [Chlamydiota bacterium]
MNAQLIAWGVQAYTALGLAAGFFAVRAWLDGSPRQAFLLLTLSTIIDATDGPLARRFETRRLLPEFNGRRLDDIVDFLNFVLVPSLILAVAEMLPERQWAWALVPVVASAYGFCQERAKTDDGFFTGFPSYWNVVVFYLYLLGCGKAFNLAIVLLFSAMVFVPVKYIDPFKTKPLRLLTAPLTVLWGLSILWLVFTAKRADPFIVRASLAYPIYYFLASFWINLRGGGS